MLVIEGSSKKFSNILDPEFYNTEQPYITILEIEDSVSFKRINAPLVNLMPMKFKLSIDTTLLSVERKEAESVLVFTNELKVRSYKCKLLFKTALIME